MNDSIDINAFSGMNDVQDDTFFIRRGVAQPKVILNADVDASGVIKKRSGKTLRVTLSGSHSLWAGLSCMLCAAGGRLYRLNGTTKTDLGAITGTEYPLSYEEVDDIVYISNPYWNTKFDPSTNALSSWGVVQPLAPILLSSTGNLPIGVYYVCMTNVVNGVLSGNGPISTISLTSVGGIQVLNRSSGAIVWCTDQNEGVFYRVGEVGTIVDIPTVEPLPSFLCTPPPLMSNLCYAFGLMWGSVGKDVYYSQPFQPTWFRTNLNKFSFDSDVTLIAKVPTGLFIGMTDKTVFLNGTEPDKMVQTSVGAGAVRGSLAYCNNVPALGDVLQTVEKGHNNVPLWRSLDGIVIGNSAGKLYNLTKDKVTMDAVNVGASLYRNVGGSFNFITSSQTGVSGSAQMPLNEETLTLFEDGEVSQHEFTHRGMGTTASISDVATCEVRRGGVII
jgi:hypothetical protein